MSVVLLGALFLPAFAGLGAGVIALFFLFVAMRLHDIENNRRMSGPLILLLRLALYAACVPPICITVVFSLSHGAASPVQAVLAFSFFALLVGIGIWKDWVGARAVMTRQDMGTPGGLLG